MEKETNLVDFGKELMSWQVPEFEVHERTNLWYVVASIIGIALLAFSFFTANFLFAVIIIIAALIIILNAGKNPDLVKFLIGSEGLIIGKKFIDYDEIKNFAVVYKPAFDFKNLYFEFKSPIRHRLSIPLGDINPLKVRENLLKYLTEDLERTDPPLSERLARLFKL